jgi:hypothetical protein
MSLGKDVAPGRANERGIEQAFESKNECEQAIPASIQKHLQIWRSVYKKVYVSPADPKAVVAEDGPGEDSRRLLVHVSCWPLGLQPQLNGLGVEHSWGSR